MGFISWLSALSCEKRASSKQIDTNIPDTMSGQVLCSASKHVTLYP